MASRLLLADDSVTIQRVIELTFADEQVEVTSVGDGREAIERIRVTPPDIVLADIAMPEQDGYEVAAFLKTQPHLAHIPVVLLSGAFEPVDEARARAVGCDAVLVKPFEPQTVINRVRELLARPRAVEHAAAAPVTAAGASERPPQARSAAAPTPGSPPVDDYFDRLDAALAGLANTSAAKRAAEPPPAAASGESPTPAGASNAALAEAFAALLAAEQGQVTAPRHPPAPVVSEELIDEIVRRVIARMGDAEMRRLVLDSAERLVREEIERIKAR